MTTHLQLLFMKVISFANETNTARVNLKWGKSCCVCFISCALLKFFYSDMKKWSKLAIFHRNYFLFFEWMLLLESWQWVHGWPCVGVRACQVEKKTDVCRWRLNPEFNAWRASKRTKNEGESGSTGTIFAYLTQQNSNWTQVMFSFIIFLIIESDLFCSTFLCVFPSTVLKSDRNVEICKKMFGNNAASAENSS